MDVDAMRELLDSHEVGEPATVVEVSLLGFPIRLRPLTAAGRGDIRRYWDDPPHDKHGTLIRLLASSLCDQIGNPKWSTQQIEQQIGQWPSEFMQALGDAIIRVNRRLTGD